MRKRFLLTGLALLTFASGLWCQSGRVLANDFLDKLESHQLGDSFYDKRRITHKAPPTGTGTSPTFVRIGEGDQYAGEWLEGVPHGYGELRTLRGDRYVGEFYQGEYDGEGEMFYRNGDHYSGAWKAGQRSGQGTITYTTGQVYTGQWDQDRRHGQGTLTFPSGSQYDGEWRDDFRHGKGKMLFDSGERYIGDYSFNRPHGYGVQVLANGDAYRGTFSKGRRHGIGECIPAGGTGRTCLYDRGTEITDPALIEIAKTRHQDFYQTVEQPFDGGIDFIIEDDFSKHPDYFRFDAAWWDRVVSILSRQLRILGESENARMILTIDHYDGAGDYVLQPDEVILTLDGKDLRLAEDTDARVTITEDAKGRILGAFQIPALVDDASQTRYALRQGRFRVFRPRR